MLSDIRSHPSFRLIPTRTDSFDEMCRLFDELDDWLRRSSVWSGMRWVEAGLDVSFDPEFLQKFRHWAAAGSEAFDDYVEQYGEYVDRAANMEW